MAAFEHASRCTQRNRAFVSNPPAQLLEASAYQIHVPVKRFDASYAHNRFPDTCVGIEVSKAIGNRPEIIRAGPIRINGELICTYINAILLSGIKLRRVQRRPAK